jgi:hypothetical protein
VKRGGSLWKLQGCQHPRFRRSFTDFHTLNPTSDIINVYSDVFKILIFFVSRTVIRFSIIVYPEDAWLAALNFVPLSDCVIQTFTNRIPSIVFFTVAISSFDVDSVITRDVLYHHNVWQIMWIMADTETFRIKHLKISRTNITTMNRRIKKKYHRAKD